MMIGGMGAICYEDGSCVDPDYGTDAAGNTIATPGGGITTPPIITPTGNSVSASGINWNALISQGFNLTKQIIQTQPGVYTQQGPNGTITYKQPLGQQSNLPFAAGGGLPTSVAGSITGTLNPSTLGVIALAGVALLVVMSMGRR